MTAGQDQVNTETASTRREGRDHRGKFARTINTAERDAEAARMRARGHTYRQIAIHLGVDVAAAHEMVKRVLAETVAEAADDVRQIELERLDAVLITLDELRETVLGVLRRKHYAFSNGRLMYLGEEPLEDDDVALRAAAQLAGIEDRRVKVSESRRKLLGLDIPVKQEIDLSGGVEYRIVGVSTEDLT